MKNFINSYFDLKNLNSSISQEVLAGLTTFLTVAYIIVVNPAILAVAGIPKEASMVATILTAFIGTLLMGLYAKRPFVIAPYMGANAFIAFTVVKVLGYPWQTALGAIFISGFLFVILTVFKLRSWFVQAIPASLKHAFVVGLGLFLTLIGLVSTNLVVLGVPAAPVKIGEVREPEQLLSIIGVILISVLLSLRAKGAILFGIVSITILGFILGLAEVPSKIISMPPSIKPILLQLDIKGALTMGFFPIILTIFIMDFVDTMGSLIGLSARAGFLDKNGNLPEIEKPMLSDAIATVSAALLGTTTAGTYIESATGIEVGGRSGLTSVVVSILFLLGLFFSPFFTSIPKFAYAPALIVVGGLMISSIKNIDFDDLTESIPAFLTIVLMVFTYNLGIGITAGFIVYPVMKVATARHDEIHPGMWGLFFMSVIFYILFPYH